MDDSREFVFIRGYISGTNMSAETPTPSGPRTGSEKLIKLTEAAGRKVSQLMQRDGVADGALRVKIVGGGCAGLEYKMDFEKNPPTPKDILIQSAGVRVLVDVKSALYVSGSEIDFQDKMIGGGFKIHNPNATATCSCGESFSV
ncbi:MAG: iron-sulfur cluster assembly accessory protein [Verrucomicrobiia bacterium]|jgi:iron-sulfur cluster assembly protein